MPTKIEWADETLNCLIGCSKCSPGCDACYAIGVVHRGMSPQHKGLTVHTEGEGTDWTGEVRAVPHLLDQPLRWKKPRRIFVNSLSDMFHPNALRLWHDPTNAPFLAELVAVMVAAKHHTFQVLTKRPNIMARVLREPMFKLDVNAALMRRGFEVMPGGMSEPETPWPAHIWWGTSIESNKYAFRADHLRATPAGVRWISAEPLLGPLDEVDLDGIDWVVAGGESGPGARPPHPAWFRDLRDRCVASGIPFLMKQWGEWSPAGTYYETRDSTHLVMPDGRDRGIPWGGWGLDQPDAEPMRRFGKKKTGRILDDLIWNQFPDDLRPPTPAEYPWGYVDRSRPAKEAVDG